MNGVNIGMTKVDKVSKKSNQSQPKFISNAIKTTQDREKLKKHLTKIDNN